jgi:hypothetical protein
MDTFLGMVLPGLAAIDAHGSGGIGTWNPDVEIVVPG